MENTTISSLAYIDSTAQIGTNVTIKPFAYIGKNVIIGDDCVIHQHATILEGTTMGNHNIIYQNAVICAEPQSFHYKGEKSYVKIGDNNCIRENVVISGSIHSNSATIIGNGNFLMDSVHICHDVHIHDNCVLGIQVQIAGDCNIDDCSILSSSVILQNNANVGKFVLVQSGSRVKKDIPPFVIIAGNPATYNGINAEILSKNTPISERILRHIANTYRLIYHSDVSLEDALIQIHQQIPKSDEINTIIAFIEKSKHGIVSRIKDND